MRLAPRIKEDFSHWVLIVKELATLVYSSTLKTEGGSVGNRGNLPTRSVTEGKPQEDLVHDCFLLERANHDMGKRIQRRCLDLF